MHVLWHSNAPTVDTGYGDQTRINAPRLRKLTGVESVTISAFYGLQGFSVPPNEDGIAVLHVADNDPWGNFTIEGHAARVFGGHPQDGLVITLQDYWTLEPEIMQRLKLASWIPIDHDPAPPAVLETMRATGKNLVPIAMSRFGEDKMREGGFDPLYVPHSIETKVLRPGPKDEAMRLFKLPEDAFLVSMVAANRASPAPTRKGFEVALQAFRIFMERHDDAYLWLQTDVTGRSNGMDLQRLFDALDYPRGPRASRHRAPTLYDYTSGQFTKGTFLRALYCASDVMLAPSMGEGFGIPIIEAQACGTPVIVSDFTAMSELCGAGWKLDGHKVWTTQNSWQWQASIDSAVDALEEAYAERGNETLRKQARTFAEGYDADRVLAKHWKPTIKTIRERLSL
jgi:glycosyltransferase involved in cell wall biosynthesis